MTKQKLFASKLLDVFKILASEPNLNFIEGNQVEILISSGETLLKVNSNDISVPGVPIHENFFEKPSSLKDSFVNDNQIQKFISALSEKESILRLNHVGFCYLVESVITEEERLKKFSKQGKWNLYKEVSQDDFTWLYVGHTKKWFDPLVEFVLDEGENDRWKNYWLPHFQIDIDTSLVVEDIEPLILETFKGKIKPYRAISANDYTYSVRARLGVIEGINVYLDVGTEGRMPRYHREKLLKDTK